MVHKMTNTMMLVGGSVVGAGLALLFAPCSGEKSRKRLSKFSRTVSKRGERAYRDLNNTMSDWTDRMNSMGRNASKMMHRWT